MTINYNVYANDGQGGPIDFAMPVATVSGTTWQSSGLGPGEWSFDVRAANAYGEEQNVDVAVAVTIGGNGQDVSNIPAPPAVLSAIPQASGAIRLEWIYPPTPRSQYPTGFHIYQGTGGIVGYSVPAATVSASWLGTSVQYSAEIGGLSNGVAYTFGVRAFNQYGEESNTLTITATAKSTGPNAVVNLSVSATT